MSEELRALIAETKRLDGEATKNWSVSGGYTLECNYSNRMMPSSNELRANAALIAAYRTLAPKLAEACETLMGDLLREKRQVEAKTKIMNALLEENRVMREALEKVAAKYPKSGDCLTCDNWPSNDHEYGCVIDASRKTLDTINCQREGREG